MRVRPATLIIAGALALAAGMASANPPASPGGGAGPSINAPAYDPTADYNAGVQALQKGDYKAATRAFDKVLGAAPNNSNVQLLAGLAKAGAGDLRGAQRHYERAVRADRNNVDARRELAMLLIRNGDARKAGDELKTLQTQAANCKQDCDKVKGAALAVEQALSGKPTAGLPSSLIFISAEKGDAAYLTAIGLVNTGRYREAIASLRTAERAFGPHPDVYTYLGFSHRKLGLLDEAEGFYQQALKVAPDHKGATEYYGELKIERGDLAGARRMLARLGELCAFGCAEEQELRRWVEAAERS